MMRDVIRKNRELKRNFLAVAAVICIVGLVVALIGCSYFGKNEDNVVLIRVGSNVTTVGDFKRAFEITKTAYPHNVLQEGNAYKEAQIRLLNQITEEMIILERAEELGIKISKAELEKAVSKIKEDYPKNVFEEMLLENAVSFESWKERLRTRLVIQKAIVDEVESKIEITPGDLSEYYKNRRKKEDSDANFEGIENEELIVKELRRKKAEEKYQKWMKELQEKYTIKINDEAWEKINT